jgi:hypothetical protein
MYSMNRRNMLSMQNRARLVLVLMFALVAPASVHAGSATITARSHCPITGATGMGRGPTLEAAKTAAIGACISKGGVPVCCMKHVGRV